MSDGNIGDTLKDLAGKVASQEVNKVTIETTVSSTTIDKPLEDTGKGPPASFIGKLLKPKITAWDSQGKKVYETAPYGEATKLEGGVVKAGLLVTVLGILGLAFGIGRGSK